MYEYARSGDVHSLKELLDTDLSVLQRRTPQGNTALHVAARFGQRPVFAEIYSRCKSLLMQPNSKGDTPLHVASGAGHLSVVKFLVTEITSTSPQLDIESGCDRRLEMLRWGNRRNNTALHEAIRNDHSPVVGLLIRADSHLVLYENSAGESPLYLAARGGMEEIVSWILTSCPLSAHSGSDGQTVLHAAVSVRHSESWATSVSHGVAGDRRLLHRDLRTELTEAARPIWSLVWWLRPDLVPEARLATRSGSRDLAPPDLGRRRSRWCRAASRDLAALDPGSPEVQAASRDARDLAALDPGSPEVQAASRDARDLAALNPRSPEVAEGRDGVAALAVLSGRANVVRCILETIELEGLINQPDYSGNTPLHLTIMERKSWIAAYLLQDARVDQTAQNIKGETAFEIDEPTEETCVIPSVSTPLPGRNSKKFMRSPDHDLK
ncbi:hypothetical protein EUGRSUZ_C00691 [Eucalyptus grandis]|uniref:Uncharacterized protein n=2 Tax=Eucalyptus grandis TaxID=71139 RepID=A0ACC3LAX7_EUCGR|nr:hypothetical protein EUGRSUZ_C00691 [Eucalyptus grandis]